jgi:hypothetical protein
MSFWSVMWINCHRSAREQFCATLLKAAPHPWFV